MIATSNRPDMIDPAVLRTGRIDRMIYVPVPDKDARRVLFEINLKDRPTEDVDCAALAERTVCRLIKAENEIYEGWTPEEQSVFLRLNRDFMEKLDAWAKTL